MGAFVTTQLPMHARGALFVASLLLCSHMVISTTGTTDGATATATNGATTLATTTAATTTAATTTQATTTQATTTAATTTAATTTAATTTAATTTAATTTAAATTLATTTAAANGTTLAPTSTAAFQRATCTGITPSPITTQTNSSLAQAYNMTLGGANQLPCTQVCVWSVNLNKSQDNVTTCWTPAFNPAGNIMFEINSPDIDATFYFNLTCPDASNTAYTIAPTACHFITSSPSEPISMTLNMNMPPTTAAQNQLKGSLGNGVAQALNQPPESVINRQLLAGSIRFQFQLLAAAAGQSTAAAVETFKAKAADGSLVASVNQALTASGQSAVKVSGLAVGGSSVPVVDPPAPPPSPSHAASLGASWVILVLSFALLFVL